MVPFRRCWRRAEEGACFTNETRKPDSRRTPTEPGCVHHLAFNVSKATFSQAVARLDERGISHTGPKDRGFMDSIYFKDPMGLMIELACYRFEPPEGHRHADVMIEAHRLRVAAGDYNITEAHLADAIEKGKADAALAASIFHFGEYSIRETKQLMAERGIPVRL